MFKKINFLILLTITGVFGVIPMQAANAVINFGCQDITINFTDTAHWLASALYSPCGGNGETWIRERVMFFM